MISIQPKWCKLIASGKKTVEVRKTRPKIDTPFKCYIYCTKPKEKNDFGLCLDRGMSGKLKSIGLLYKQNYETALNMGMDILSGKVIGEFVCDEFTYIETGYDTNGHKHLYNTAFIEHRMCIPDLELFEYLYQSREKCGGWAWHISDLVIYDKPKELSEFYVLDEKAIKECKHRERVYVNPDSVNGAWLKGSYICTKGEEDWCSKCKTKLLKRPFQSWGYVEDGI